LYTIHPLQKINIACSKLQQGAEAAASFGRATDGSGRGDDPLGEAT